MDSSTKELIDVAAAEKLAGIQVYSLVEQVHGQVGVAMKERREGSDCSGADITLRVHCESAKRRLHKSQPRRLFPEKPPDGECCRATGGVQRRTLVVATLPVSGGAERCRGVFAARDGRNHLDEFVVEWSSGVRLDEVDEPSSDVVVAPKADGVPADVEELAEVDSCVGETTQNGAYVRVGGARGDPQKKPGEPLGVLLGQGLEHMCLRPRVADESTVAPGGPGAAWHLASDDRSCDVPVPRRSAVERHRR